ncbi:hypothetical protein [Treponema sp.]|uniref:hypothetical protein n=1 Tax=Treponema sp. TaxID=166 RepID=UPI00345CD85D
MLQIIDHDKLPCGKKEHSAIVSKVSGNSNVSIFSISKQSSSSSSSSSSHLLVMSLTFSVNSKSCLPKTFIDAGNKL